VRGAAGPARQRALLAGLILLHLVPVWGFSHFLTQDGPAHLDSANVLRLYADAGHPLYRTVYQLNPDLEPNLIGHALTSRLLAFLPVAAVEKLLVTCYVVLLPLALGYAARASGSGFGFASVLVFPFLLNWVLAMGFYNFALSLPLLFALLGYWWRNRLRLGPWRMLCLSLLAILLYLSHVVSLVMGLVVLGVQLAWLEALALREASRRGERVVLRIPLARALRLSAALSPALLLLGGFLTRKGAGVPPAVPLADSWQRLRELETLVLSGGAERWVVTFAFWGLLAAAAAALAIRLRASWSPAAADAWLLAAAAAVLVYLVAPRGMAGGAALKERLILFPLLLLLPWLAAQPFAPRAFSLLQKGAVCAALALLGLRFPAQRALDAQLREYLSVGGAIPRGALLLPLCYEPRGLGPDGHPLPLRTAPFVHAAGYLAAERDALQLANYEGNKGHFPLLFRPDWNPYTRLGPYSGIESEPPCVEFEAFNQRVSQPIDYVLTWGLETYERRSAEAWAARPHKFREARGCVASVRAQLAAAYELVDVSEPNGWARLYRRR
jgi:hypothetical protein